MVRVIRRHRTVQAAAGGLEHPGIVPVYGLGTYDGGRPYYAMRFIRGDSLKEAIEQFHSDPTLKADPGRRSSARPYRGDRLGWGRRVATPVDAKYLPPVGGVVSVLLGAVTRHFRPSRLALVAHFGERR